MSAKDRYVVNFECPKCKNQGSAKVSEDDHPWIRSPGLSIDNVFGEFEAVYDYPDYHANAQMLCKPCGVPFQLFPQFGKPTRLMTLNLRK